VRKKKLHNKVCFTRKYTNIVKAALVYLFVTYNIHRHVHRTKARSSSFLLSFVVFVEKKRAEQKTVEKKQNVKCFVENIIIFTAGILVRVAKPRGILDGT